MRKLAVVFFVLVLTGASVVAYAGDCTKDTVVDRFGDWFGNLGKKEKQKARNIAARKANRLAACNEKKALDSAKEQKS